MYKSYHTYVYVYIYIYMYILYIYVHAYIWCTDIHAYVRCSYVHAYIVSTYMHAYMSRCIRIHAYLGCIFIFMRLLDLHVSMHIKASLDVCRIYSFTSSDWFAKAQEGALLKGLPHEGPGWPLGPAQPTRAQGCQVGPSPRGPTRVPWWALLGYPCI